MISLKVLSTVAAMALLVPVVAPSESFAQGFGQNGKGGGGGAVRGGGGGGGAARMGGGGGGGPRFSGGGGGASAPRFNGGGGGGYAYRRGGGGGGFIPGAVAGALVGGALVGGYGYGYGPGYGYYDDQYYDGAVAVAPAGDDAVAYCMQTYRSYDPGSGTYLGSDGYRHPCP
jgi:BA14K-like protein